MTVHLLSAELVTTISEHTNKNHKVKICIDSSQMDKQGLDTRASGMWMLCVVSTKTVK
jgi:hypothetical protein